MSAAPAPLWIEIAVALLLLASAALALASAIGLIRLRGFFIRMHAPALTATLGAWCVTAAAVLYFSALEDGLAAYYGLIAIFITLTVPITTALLTRAALLRQRARQEPDTPSPLSLRAMPPERAR
jgi:multicomponent K+:H+ antiporter subunit G